MNSCREDLVGYISFGIFNFIVISFYCGSCIVYCGCLVVFLDFISICW